MPTVKYAGTQGIEYRLPRDVVENPLLYPGRVLQWVKEGQEKLRPYLDRFVLGKCEQFIALGSEGGRKGVRLTLLVNRDNPENMSIEALPDGSLIVSTIVM
jgi:hypothetical protein